MRIRKVRLCNFSSYAGDNSIDLETREGKNVILIGGNNGAGKTSLFTAIKLALYGPQCFKYQDKNFHYYGRIRELINHDAYLFDTVTAFVELEIILPTERRLSVYQIHRGWTVRDRHLDEEYYVIQDGSKLNSKDLDFFQNYLYNIVPPNLFDFFFFDGEEVGEFFSTGSYNKYIKNAVLTLSGYDTFSLIRKFCRSFIATEEDNEAYENAAIEAQNAEEERTALEACINEIQNQRETISDSIAKQVGNRDALNSKFQSAGGISKEERSSLVQQQINPDIELWQAKKINELRKKFSHLKKLNSYQAILYIINKMEYGDFMKERGLDESKIHTLLSIASQNEVLPIFIERMNTLKSIVNNGSSDENSLITLSTIHSSKGLEYKNVIMIDVRDGIFPSVPIDEENEKDMPQNILDTLEEERRLFYVGVTRAKEKFEIFSYESEFGKACDTALFTRQLLKLDKPKKEKTDKKTDNTPLSTIKSKNILKEALISRKKQIADSKTINIKKYQKGDTIIHKTYGKAIIEEYIPPVCKIRLENGEQHSIDIEFCLKNNIIKSEN